MKGDICFICFGQCAGNIGTLLERKGYPVLYVNTASVDLQLLKHAKHVYKIPGERGCNQNPEKAQAVFAQHYAGIMQKIGQFADRRIAYFVCSAGGGTGGGMVPLALESYLECLGQREDEEWEAFDRAAETDQCAKPPVKRKAGLVAVLPGVSESVVINANSYEFMRQVGEILDREMGRRVSNMASIILLDNELGKDVLELNRRFVDLLHGILSIPERHSSVRGNVDAADLESAFTAIGVTSMVSIGKEEFSEAVLAMRLKNGDVCAPAEHSVAQYWVSSTASAVDDLSLEKEIGVPKAHYKTFNDVGNLFVFSGMGLPAERLDLIAERANEYPVCKQQQNRDIFNRDVSSVRMAPQPEQPVPGQSGDVAPTAKLNVQDKLNKLRRRRT